MTVAGRLRKAGWAEGFIQGFTEGFAEGFAEGVAEERAHFLERLMQLKFGPLSAETRARIAAADLDTQRVYIDRILTAPDPSAVFSASTDRG